ncbi:MAG: carbonic anhydrase [Bacteroidetes bacterium]|nr:carbonic anhydrase [Bacteroidota bacterium]
MTPFEKLLLENKAWSHEKTEEDPEYFHKLAQLQTPEFLWIGCSDSRVPANEITNTQPGEIFVHRNISNLVVHTDVNLLSVLDYAVNHLKVNHVIVCGHYGCGGIKAAMSNHTYDLVLNMWLRYIKDVYCLYEEELSAIKDEEQRADRLVELNVKEQVLKLAKTSIIQRAWKERNSPVLHGWAYGLKDGIIKDLFNLQPGDFSSVTPIYQFDDL